MAEFKKKQHSRKIWYSPLILFVLLCVVLVFIYNMIDIVEKTRETAKKRNVVLGQINELHQREEALKNDIATIQTEAGMESAIREKYQLVKAGEKMVVIVDEAKTDKEIETTQEPFQFLMFFKNIFR